MQALSGGRLTLGLAIGARDDDYDAAASPPRAAARGSPTSSPSCATGTSRRWCRGTIKERRPELLVGGMSGAAFARMARYGDGYAHGGGPPRAFASAAAKALAAWSDLGRPGRPALWGQAYFALGDEAAGEEYLLDYYAFTGPVRRQDRRRQPHLAARHPRLRARLRGGRLRRARAAADGRRPRAARAAGRGPRVRTTVLGAGPAGPVPLDPAQEGRPARTRWSSSSATRPTPPSASASCSPRRRSARLRDADEPTFTAITDALATWTTIDVHFGGEVIRSHGHGFSAIRAHASCSASSSAGRASWGSSCASSARSADLGELPDADLLVGADGINSLVRRAHEARSRRGSTPTPRASPGSAPTRARRVHLRVRRDRARRLPGARLSVRRATRARSSSRRARTPGGAPGSTRLSEPESLAFCRELFAPVLDGHELLSNRSVWLAFNELRCKDWSAARRCCWATPRIPRTSRSARAPSSRSRTRSSSPLRSGAHDDAGRRAGGVRARAPARGGALPGGGAPERRVLRGGPAPLGLPPLQFAFNLLTRSGRIGHANLSLRDPRLVRRVDAFLGGRRGARARRRCSRRWSSAGSRSPTAAVVLRRATTAPGWSSRRASRSRPTGGSRPTTRSTLRPGATTSRRSTRRAAPRCSRCSHAGRRGACRPRVGGRRPAAARGRLAAGLGLADPLRPPQRHARRARRGGHGARSATRSSRRRGAAPRRGSTPSSSTSARATCSARSSRAQPPDATRTARTRCASRARSSRRCAPRGTARSPSGCPTGRAPSSTPPRCARPAPTSSTSPTGQATERAAAEYRRGHLTAFSDRIRSEARVRDDGRRLPRHARRRQHDRRRRPRGPLPARAGGVRLRREPAGRRDGGRRRDRPRDRRALRGARRRGAGAGARRVRRHRRGRRWRRSSSGRARSTCSSTTRGSGESAPLARTTLESWRAHLDVNATGAFLCTRAVVAGMRARGRGVIVTVASTAGERGAPYIAAYTAAKHAAVGLMRAAARRAGGHGRDRQRGLPDVRGHADDRAHGGQHRRADRPIARRGARARSARCSTPTRSRPRSCGSPRPRPPGISGQTLVIDGGGIQT